LIYTAYRIGLYGSCGFLMSQDHLEIFASFDRNVDYPTGITINKAPPEHYEKMFERH